MEIAMHNDEALGRLLDQINAASFLLQAFMLKTALDSARKAADPDAWVTGFISDLHEMIDVNEASARVNAAREGLSLSTAHYEIAQAARYSRHRVARALARKPR
jgi:hypothetical protein